MRWWQGWLHRHEPPKPAALDLFSVTCPGKVLRYGDAEYMVIERHYRRPTDEKVPHVTITLREVYR